jgi:hypothetical protein
VVLVPALDVRVVTCPRFKPNESALACLTLDGLFTSLGLFETPEQSVESTKLVTTWIHEEKLETILPNEPKITSGKIVARSSDRVLVAA